MGPKRGGGKELALAAIKPSGDELQAAKKIIEGAGDPGKKEKASMASMCQFIKNNPDLNQDALMSRGEQRKQFMLNYLVMQSRAKKARLEACTVRTIDSTNQEVAKKPGCPTST